MGCDIHTVAQVCKDGQWKTVATNIAGENRNYDTFAVLANVRNGRGFAGIVTGDGFIPIAEPRGLPADFDKDRDIPADHWLGDHSHSWHTLGHIQAYIAVHGGNTTRKRGYVTAEQFDKLKPGEEPGSYCGGVSGGGVLCMDRHEYTRYKEMGTLDFDDREKLARDRAQGWKGEKPSIYVNYEWTVGYLQTTELEAIRDELQKIADEHGVTADNVRMVFGFDS